MVGRQFAYITDGLVCKVRELFGMVGLLVWDGVHLIRGKWRGIRVMDGRENFC